MHTGFWWGNLKKREAFEYLGVDWRIILKWTSKVEDGVVWPGLIWLRTGNVVDCYEHGNEILYCFHRAFFTNSVFYQQMHTQKTTLL
jgi:hypothetical protein